MQSLVKVLTLGEEPTVLFTCSIEELHLAYAYARDMEEMGLEVRIDSPTLPQTLALMLGPSEEEMEQFEQDLVCEVDCHSDAGPNTQELKVP